MKHASTYEACKRLALYGDCSQNPGVSIHSVYVDPFGCDLYVYYNSMLHRGLGEMKESLYVCLGGRSVYIFYEDSPSLERFVGGRWERLVSELWEYEFSIRMEESYVVNGALLELCKKEAMKNREVFARYCEPCSALARKKGELKTFSKRSRGYVFKTAIDGHKVKIYLFEARAKKDGLSYDEIELSFDGKRVFKFQYNCNKIGSTFDDKGEFTLGEWQEILIRMIEG